MQSREAAYPLSCPSPCGATGDQRRSKQSHERLLGHCPQLPSKGGRGCRSWPVWLARVRNGSRPPRQTQPGLSVGLHRAAAWLWAVPATSRQETPLFHFSSRHGDGGSVGPRSAPSIPCPDRAADRCPRAELKGLAGVRGPFHSRFSFPRHAGCQAPLQGAELPGQAPPGPLLQELFISEAVIWLGCSGACRREQQRARRGSPFPNSVHTRKLSKIAIPG